MPASELSSADLPLPTRPSTQISSPGSMRRSTSVSTGAGSSVDGQAIEAPVSSTVPGAPVAGSVCSTGRRSGSFRKVVILPNATRQSLRMSR